MNILISGDSQTKGQVGISFVDLLAEHYPGSRFINHGTNGDTFNIISQKLLQHLDKRNDYDALVLQGGGNDLLLPVFKKRGGLFGFAYDAQIKKGLVPATTAADYYRALAETFKAIKSVFTGRVIFMTMSCINEKQDTPLNRARRQYNQEARKAAQEYRIELADIEPAFDAYLSTRDRTDYLIESFWAVTCTDRIFCLSSKGAQYLSTRRKLSLTIDGAHLNKAGACIIRDVLVNVIDSKSL